VRDDVPPKRRKGIGHQGYQEFQSCVAGQMEMKSIPPQWRFMGKGIGVKIWWLAELE